MAETWQCVRVSSSLGNWKQKILNRTNLPEYRFLRDYKKSVAFFGLYHPIDWFRFLLHRGRKKIVWCGSDILQVGWFFKILQKIPAEHLCESLPEWGVLTLMLQRKDIEMRPLLFNDPDKYKICFKPSETPQVFMNINNNAEIESGLPVIQEIAPVVPEVTFHIYGRVKSQSGLPNIVYHGLIPEEQFDEEIKNYQASVRLHYFDGFSENTAKSILMGQYPITAIPYPSISHADNESELIYHLRELKYRKQPNSIVRDHYYEILSQPLV